MIWQVANNYKGGLMQKKYIRDKNYNSLNIGDFITYKGSYKYLIAKIVGTKKNNKVISVKHENGTMADIWANDTFLQTKKGA
jgi:hypothetical protein